MAAKTPQTFTDAIHKMFSIKMKNKFAVKRAWDDWAFKQLWAERKRKWTLQAHRFDYDAHVKLGPDLAVARYVVNRCQASILDEKGRWITSSKQLPPDYSRAFKVIGVDMRHKKLLCEALDNLVGLEHVQYLNLSHNPGLDDFACDQLSRQYRQSKTLREIDLSYNPFISIYGLEILFRIPSIRRITAIETQASKYDQIDLFTMAAEEERNCDVFVHKNNRQYADEALENIRLESINQQNKALPHV